MILKDEETSFSWLLRTWKIFLRPPEKRKTQKSNFSDNHPHNIWDFCSSNRNFDAPQVKLKQLDRGKLKSQGIYPWDLSMGIRLKT